MEKYQNVVQGKTGAVIVGASVRVQTYPGAIDATIYSDDGVTPATNPLTTDSKGEFSFYAENGRYQLVISRTGIATSTKTDILLFDSSAGDGTVSSVSVVTANGISGSVADATTTPAITLALGAITPTTIVASGAVTGASFTTAGQFTSSVATGTPPLVVASTTNVPNLNASSLNGATFAAPGAIGGGTPAAGAFTTLSATGQITSTLASGTAPFVVASTTVVANLNVSQLLGGTWAIPGTIGSTTPSTGAFTTLSATGQITSTLASGTAPLVVASTTVVANLNASLLNGATFAAPGSIGSGTPGSGAFTTVSASGQITSTLSTGTAPFVVASTTAVSNLNASLLLGSTWAAPGTIGSGTPSTGAFTTLAGTTITASTAFSGPAGSTSVPSFNFGDNSGLRLVAAGFPGMVSGGSSSAVWGGSATPGGNFFSAIGLSSNPATNVADVVFIRDAAAQGAFRNSTTAQTIRVYRTFTDTSNYERMALQSGAGYFEMAAETAGTGTDDIDLRLTPSSTTAAVDFRNPVNGAAAGAGTISNAPSAGNPAYWLKIKIAGTTHYIPAWT